MTPSRYHRPTIMAPSRYHRTTIMLLSFFHHPTIMATFRYHCRTIAALFWCTCPTLVQATRWDREPKVREKNLVGYSNRARQLEVSARDRNFCVFKAYNPFVNWVEGIRCLLLGEQLLLSQKFEARDFVNTLEIKISVYLASE